MVNTRDFSNFGFIELKEAAALLTEFVHNDDVRDCFSTGVAVEFNPESGNVFLVDEDFNVAMICDGDLEMFYSCSECGHEGFKEDFKDQDCGCCKAMYKDLCNDK